MFLFFILSVSAHTREEELLLSKLEIEVQELKQSIGVLKSLITKQPEENIFGIIFSGPITGSSGIYAENSDEYLEDEQYPIIVEPKLTLPEDNTVPVLTSIGLKSNEGDKTSTPITKPPAHSQGIPYHKSDDANSLSDCIISIPWFSPFSENRKTRSTSSSGGKPQKNQTIRNEEITMRQTSSSRPSQTFDQGKISYQENGSHGRGGSGRRRGKFPYY